MTLGFWKGAIIGGLAGVAYGVWTAPKSGEDMRSTLTSSLENTLFKVTGMEVWKPETANPQTWSVTAANPADWETQAR